MTLSPCWFPSLGSARSPVDNVSYMPTAEQCRAALIGGHSQRAPQLQRGETLHVAVLGGSISCGSLVPISSAGPRLTRPPPDATSGSFRGGGREHSWPTLLGTVLADEMRGTRDVVVHNLCERAVGSDHWVAKLAAAGASLLTRRNQSSAEQGLAAAHVVLVEAAANDVEAYSVMKGSADATAGYTEILARQLLALPRQPYVAWVTAGWAGFAYGRVESAEAQQLHITKAYGLAHVSVPAGLAPSFASPSEPRAIRFARSIYFQDCCHPGRLGHKLVAAFVAYMLLQRGVGGAGGVAGAGAEGGTGGLVVGAEASGAVATAAPTTAASPALAAPAGNGAASQGFLTPLAAQLVPLLLVRLEDPHAFHHEQHERSHHHHQEHVRRSSQHRHEASVGLLGSRPTAAAAGKGKVLAPVTAMHLNFALRDHDGATASPPLKTPPWREAVAASDGWSQREFAPEKVALVAAAQPAGAWLLIVLPTGVRLLILGLLHSYHSSGTVVARVLEWTDDASGGASSSSSSLCRRLSADAMKAMDANAQGNDDPMCSGNQSSSAPSPYLIAAGSGRRVGKLRVRACRRIHLQWKLRISVNRAELLTLDGAEDKAALPTSTSRCSSTWLSLRTVDRHGTVASHINVSTASTGRVVLHELTAV